MIVASAARGPRYRFHLRSLLISIVACAVGFAGLKAWLTARAYPYSGVVEWTIREHSLGTEIITMTVFSGRNQATADSESCEVRPNGEVWAVHDIYSWAVQGGSGKTLSPPQIRQLLALTAALPPSDGLPDWDKLFLVSFAERGRRVTRFYDRTKLPAPIKALQGLTGLPTP